MNKAELKELVWTENAVDQFDLDVYEIARINHLVDSGATAQHESLEDSFKDLANYAIIGMMVLRGKWPTE